MKFSDVLDSLSIGTLEYKKWNALWISIACLVSVKSTIAPVLDLICFVSDIEHEEAEILPWTRRMITLLKSRHVHKRAKVQYEVRTHVIKLNLLNLTGSSASCILEYVQVSCGYVYIIIRSLAFLKNVKALTEITFHTISQPLNLY